MYLIALFIPPLAVLMCGKPFQAILAFFLWLCIWIPGSIYACMVVADFKANERNDKLIRAIRGRHSSTSRAEAPTSGEDPFAF